jgi:hypothetical protein
VKGEERIMKGNGTLPNMGNRNSNYHFIKLSSLCKAWLGLHLA